MKFVIGFTGEIECKDWKDAEQKVFILLKELDNHLEEYSLFLEESKGDDILWNLKEKISET